MIIDNLAVEFPVLYVRLQEQLYSVTFHTNSGWFPNSYSTINTGDLPYNLKLFVSCALGPLRNIFWGLLYQNIPHCISSTLAFHLFVKGQILFEQHEDTDLFYSNTINAMNRHKVLFTLDHEKANSYCMDQFGWEFWALLKETRTIFDEYSR